MNEKIIRICCKVKNDDWTPLAMAGLESAYGENEPEYSLDLIIEPNLDYDRRTQAPTFNQN